MWKNSITKCIKECAHLQCFLSSLISSMSNIETNTATTTKRAAPPIGFITSQLMIGVIMYAVINRAARIRIMRNKRIVNISPTLSTLLLQFVMTSYINTYVDVSPSRKVFIGYLVFFFCIH
jgi:hypothetical protein